MIKVSYLNYIYDMDGMAQGAINKSKSFSSALASYGYEVTTHWLGRSVTTDPNAAAISRRKQVFQIVKKFLGRFLHEPKILLMNVFLMLKIIKRLRKDKPDIVLERLTYMNFAGALVCKLFKWPMVVESDYPPVHEFKNNYGRKFFHIPFMAEGIKRFTLLQARGIFVISQQMKDFYAAQGIPEDKMFVIPNGADTGRLYPMPRAQWITEKYDIHNKTVIGWVGALAGWSGIESTVSLIKTMLEEREDIAFMLIGGGSNEQFLKKTFASSLSKASVIIPGSVPFDQLNDYLSCIDIAIAPYPKLDFWWASSMKVFEYMAAGKAVVASGVGQLNEVIQSGENGLLFDPTCPNDMEKKIRELLDNPALISKLGKKARKDVEAHYTWTLQAGKMSEVLSAALKG